uniref:Phosphatidic acid phosphatase type 2/haloperoxidase domain-containing protein n=1 Tax=Glossina pallidipes TaxID=7398 RepID=A0A1B0AHS6_GLOPL
MELNFNPSFVLLFFNIKEFWHVIPNINFPASFVLRVFIGLPILLFFVWGDPYKRGFFCDDESLMHPFKDSTIKSWMLYVIGLLIPIGVMLLVEILQSRHNERISNGNSTSRRYVFMDYDIPDWMLEAYKKIGVFGFGVLVTQLTTDIAKYSIGRLRPHFFAVCQPIMPGGTTCASFLNQNKYIMDFHCKGVGSTERMLKEARLSFPSGHSSFSFFTMVYLAMYLQSRMTWQGSKLLRHFLQFCFIMVAWYTALSRVSDYKHHWSDVLAGTVIGSLLAIVVANYVSDLFSNKKNCKTYALPQTVQDVTQTQTTNDKQSFQYIILKKKKNINYKIYCNLFTLKQKIRKKGIPFNLRTSAKIYL